MPTKIVAKHGPERLSEAPGIPLTSSLQLSIKIGSVYIKWNGIGWAGSSIEVSPRCCKRTLFIRNAIFEVGSLPLARRGWLCWRRCCLRLSSGSFFSSVCLVDFSVDFSVDLTFVSEIVAFEVSGIGTIIRVFAGVGVMSIASWVLFRSIGIVCVCEFGKIIRRGTI